MPETGSSVLCLNVGQGDMLQTRGDLCGRRVIIMCLIVMLLAEMTDAISDFGINSLIIQSNEDLHMSTARNKQTKRPKVRFTVRLHLPGIQMNQQLSDRTSPQYTTLSRSLSRDIRRLFANTAGKQSVSNIRFRKFRKNHKDHGSLNEAGSVQKEIHTSASPPRSKSFSVTSLASESPRPVSTHRPRHRASSTTPFRRPTVAARTPSKGLLRLPLNATTTTKVDLFDAEDNDMTVATAVPSTTTTLERTPTPPEKTFDTGRITKLFKECFTRSHSGEYSILLDKYLDAYTELMGVFAFFGPVFSFAGDDIKDKITKLRDIRKRDIEESQNNYLTFQSMFEYEFSQRGSPAQQAGVSTNRWIHRALKFISELIKASMNTTSHKSLADYAQELYIAIIAPYHPWYVRTVAYLAVLSFPTRSDLMEGMGIKDNEEGLQELADLASAIDAVYEDVENLYVKYLL